VKSFLLSVKKLVLFFQNVAGYRKNVAGFAQNPPRFSHSLFTSSLLTFHFYWVRRVSANSFLRASARKDS